MEITEKQKVLLFFFSISFIAILIWLPDLFMLLIGFTLAMSVYLKEILRGEMVSKNGEEPTGKVTKSHYSYQSPENKQSQPKVTSSTTTSILSQRRKLSGPKIQEIEDSEVQESEKTSRRYSKEYVVEEEEGDDWKRGRVSVGSGSRRESACEERSSTERTTSASVPSRTPNTSQDKTSTSKKTVVRGDSVRALQHKFQQATEAANQPRTRSYPPAGLILRSNSLQQNDDADVDDEEEGMSSTVKRVSQTVTERRDSKTKLQESRSREVKSSSPVVMTQVTSQQDSRIITSTENSEADQVIGSVTKAGASFLDNNTKVTGVQDVLNRMRNANLVVESDDTAEDAEARALLNKFLGASVILQGMEQGMKAAHASQSPSSAALVSQAEKQRVLSTSTRKSEDIEEISDEKQLRILLEACSDYEDRRKIRARLRSIMTDQKGSGEGEGVSKVGSGDREGECVGGGGWRCGAISTVDDSGTESGEDLKQVSAEVLEEVGAALSQLEGALPGLEPARREAIARLVAGLQTWLRLPREAAKKPRSRHTVGVTPEEVALARREHVRRQPSQEAQPAPATPVRMTLSRGTLLPPPVHKAGFFMEPAPQVAAVSFVDPQPPFKSASGSLLDYDPSLNLFTPEQSVQIAVHKAAINKQISQEEMKRRESSDDGDISSPEEDDPEAKVSSAQRLLQLASDASKKPSAPNRHHPRNSKKQKIKRANTIDIPKACNFYEHSSGDEYGGCSADEGNQSDLPMSTKKTVDKVPPPTFEPKTENDLKFLAFLKQANESAQAKVKTYNPSARGGKHWSNRFTNIRTSFEGPETYKSPPTAASNPAKLFWHNSQATSQNPVPSKTQFPKMPWSVKTERDGVVVGSLTVAKNPPGPINQFTHASKSAFKPVERKSQPISPASGNVKLLATQKFSDPSKSVHKQVMHQENIHHRQNPSHPDHNKTNQFSNNSSSTQRYYNVPQGSSQHHGKDFMHNSNYNDSKIPYNLSQSGLKSQNPNKEPVMNRDSSRSALHSNYHPTAKPGVQKPLESQKYPDHSSIAPPTYTSNVSVAQRLNDRNKVTSDLVQYPPAETYLKTHPKYPDHTIQQRMGSSSPEDNPPKVPQRHIYSNRQADRAAVEAPDNRPIPPERRHYNKALPRDNSYLSQSKRIPDQIAHSNPIEVPGQRIPLQPNPVSVSDTENRLVVDMGIESSNGQTYSSEKNVSLKDDEPISEGGRLVVDMTCNYLPEPPDLAHKIRTSPYFQNSGPPAVDMYLQNHNLKPDDNEQLVVNMASDYPKTFQEESNACLRNQSYEDKPQIVSPIYNTPMDDEPGSRYPDRIRNTSQRNSIIESNSPLSNGQSNTINFNGGSMQSESTQITNEVSFPSDQHSSNLPHNNLLSPYNLPPSNNGVVSPVRTFYNNVSPRPNERNTSPAVNHSSRYEDDSVPVSPSHWSDRSSPVDCTEEKAVIRVMGQAQCQKAVTVNNRTRHRFDSGGRGRMETELRLQLQECARQRALSPLAPGQLQRSESWHQIVKERMGQAKQAPPLPRIYRAKSSHSLAFASEKLTEKQSTVSQYLSHKKTDKPMRPALKTQESIVLNVEDIDNVDEVFESIFQESNKKRNSK